MENHDSHGRTLPRRELEKALSRFHDEPGSIVQIRDYTHSASSEGADDIAYMLVKWLDSEAAEQKRGA